MISPQTDIRLLKCPLTLSNKHQITFANKEAQETYFLSLPYIEDRNASYQRKDNVIRFNAHFDDLIMYSYCMYKNTNYSDKWFYAFITNMRYINDNVTEITILTDVFQTWQFDIIYRQSFIEREIIPKNLDIAGDYLIPEGLEFGELKIDGNYEITDLDPCYIVAYSGDHYIDADGNSHSVSQEGYSYNGIYSSVTFILANRYGFKNLMRLLNQADNSEKILTVFSIPSLAVKSKLPVDPPRSTHIFF